MIKKSSLYIDKTITDFPLNMCWPSRSAGFRNAMTFFDDLAALSANPAFAEPRSTCCDKAHQFFTQGTFEQKRIALAAQGAHRMACEIRLLEDNGKQFFQTATRWYPRGSKESTLFIIVGFEIHGNMMANLSWS